eukprot:Plantae.Rhodophyta-Purpureofilum_apyrenoidigerum.ctg15763.p1 GENE.Plantae.Rhodophyta-Purpureofilum_apyrenoidigerum.ctg15763~~Plantae.Rhodophyta-Purpureofilum_apyrenoidigerum.ctg15763.p1  ORF type:complete len:233 (-),score=38.04 Plantae.Rhodophyta-Purpureofilum_apyrenoidigerum.ctg15763:56-754(-)
MLRVLSVLRKRDPDIDEVGISFASSEEPFVLVDHKLGIAHKSLQELYVEARSVLAREDASAEEIEAAAFAALVVNPDFFPAWNRRRALVNTGFLSEDEELQVNALILTRSSKEFETWAYRRYLVSRVELSTERIEKEFAVCERAAEMRQSNYYAWTHRIIVAQYLPREMLPMEGEMVQMWLSTHISDHSAWHYWQSLLDVLGREDGGRFLSDIEVRYGASQCTVNLKKAMHK